MATNAADILAVMDDAIRLATDRWQHFVAVVPFKEGVLLQDRIISFMIPFEAGLKEAFPAFDGAPEGVSLMVIAKGIERSGTHTAEEIAGALGLPGLPG